MTLGGNVCIRNGNRLDYCWKESVKSLLPICDEVVVCDSDSDDGTREELNAWAESDERITLVNLPWSNPKCDPEFWPKWLNYSRQHLDTDWHIQLDADEVLHEADYPVIRQAAQEKQTLFFKRLNFWLDPQHLIPEGVCCGTKVLRMASAKTPLPSDYPYEPAKEAMDLAVESDIRVFHYGFLRERDAFFRKAREVQHIWCGTYDPRLEAAEKYEGHWAQMPGVTGWEDRLVSYEGGHPEVIRPWLKSHGY